MPLRFPALLIIFLSLPRSGSGQDGATLRLWFLDVGQGDAALIRSPEGKSVLVDTGEAERAGAVLAALRARGVERLNLAVLSHPHTDHMGALREVLAGTSAGLLLDPAFPHPTAAYERLLGFVRERAVPYRIARRGMRLMLDGGAAIEVLAPEEPLLSGTRSDANANSVVLRLTYGKFAALLTGDAEAESERRLIVSGQPLAADVLKVAHHGSRFASGAEFLAAVGPMTAVISCGAGNDYGHPHPEALDRLRAAGAAVRRTDLEGTIAVTTRGDGFTVESERAPPAPADLAAAGRPSARARFTEEPAAAPSAPPFLASRRSEVYHRAGCSSAATIKAENLVTFATREAATAAGRRPCKLCSP